MGTTGFSTFKNAQTIKDTSNNMRKSSSVAQGLGDHSSAGLPPRSGALPNIQKAVSKIVKESRIQPFIPRQ